MGIGGCWNEAINSRFCGRQALHEPGSVKADSHVAAAVDSRSYDEIYQKDMQSFIQLMPQLDVMLHVIYDQVDPNPAGFHYWIQNHTPGASGRVCTDDLTSTYTWPSGINAHSGGIAAFDMGLVCNSRERLYRWRALPVAAANQRLGTHARQCQFKSDRNLDLGPAWAQTRDRILDFKHQYSA